MVFIVLAYVLFGLYFVNYTFSFVTIPTFISGINKWIIFVGGLLILFGAINYYRLNKV